MQVKFKQKRVKQLFSQSQPLSINSRSIYKSDYECLYNNNWLRTQTINSILHIILNNHLSQINQLVENSIKKSMQQKQKYDRYVTIIDPFIVTMIQFTRHEEQPFIIQSLQSLEFFHSQTKYIMFPANLQQYEGNHWFLILLKNPLYNPCSQKQDHQFPKIVNQQFPLFILNSTSGSQSHQFKKILDSFTNNLVIMLKLFHKIIIEKKNIKIIHLRKISLQQNSYDCGIFVIGYVQKLLQIIKQQIERIVKLGAIKRQIKEDTQILLESSVELRNQYRQMLQQILLEQNQKKDEQNKQQIIVKKYIQEKIQNQLKS